MYKNITLSASIMCMNWLDLRQELLELENTEIDYLHVDIIDGEFAPDFTMGSSIVNLIRKNTKIKFDYHLMVEEPSRVFNAFPTNDVDYFSIHQESSRNLHRDLMKIKSKGCKVGVVLNPGTSIETLEYIIEEVDLVTLMTVNPGYMGQKLVPQVLKKIKKAKNLIDSYKLLTKISVDGNVNHENIPKMLNSGADHLVLGSSGLFREGISIKKSLEELKTVIDKNY